MQSVGMIEHEREPLLQCWLIESSDNFVEYVFPFLGCEVHKEVRKEVVSTLYSYPRNYASIITAIQLAVALFLCSLSQALKGAYRLF